MCRATVIAFEGVWSYMREGGLNEPNELPLDPPLIMDVWKILYITVCVARRWRRMPPPPTQVTVQDCNRSILRETIRRG